MKKIKQLQNNFTTPDQSKRLLELGVPSWTADCYYYEENCIYEDSTPQIVSFGEIWVDNSEETMFSSYVDLPCWSVGRLIEIFNICAHGYFAYIKTTDDKPLIKQVLSRYECECKIVGMDFSKLED